MRDEYKHRTRISRFSNGYVAQCTCGWVSSTEHTFEDDSSPEEHEAAQQKAEDDATDHIVAIL